MLSLFSVFYPPNKTNPTNFTVYFPYIVDPDKFIPWWHLLQLLECEIEALLCYYSTVALV